jgi:hypothetical protein
MCSSDETPLSSDAKMCLGLSIVYVRKRQQVSFGGGNVYMRGRDFETQVGICVRTGLWK